MVLDAQLSAMQGMAPPDIPLDSGPVLVRLGVGLSQDVRIMCAGSRSPHKGTCWGREHGYRLIHRGTSSRGAEPGVIFLPTH